MKYQCLLRILDQIAGEAPERFSAKYPRYPSTEEARSQMRARALVHLYLKVSFGLIDFEVREHFVTDGGYDGGIDAYYIDSSTRTIYLVQSKFRTTEGNFEEKQLSLQELFAMDIDRVLNGELADEAGNSYNGKIKQLQREVSAVEDIARYRYQVVLLANLAPVSPSKLSLLVNGYPVEVFDSKKTYKELVFPVLCGTYFTALDMTIPIDLSNKNAGSKISYSVQTKFSECEITVLFVPAIEIGRIMHTYKNSILKYNPRSYLEHEGQAVNSAIRDTVVRSQSNELALYNNGITMLSEETFINERIGQKNKAQLSVRNPQIINGGQTSFTLSRIYSESLPNAEEIFGGKEILLKVITVPTTDHQAKEDLIGEISVATNRQTPVIGADRFANDSFHQRVQELIFDRYGILYERKRGEFSDGVRDRYVDPAKIVERNGFWRTYYAANGDLDKAIQKKLFQKNRVDTRLFDNLENLDRWHLGIELIWSLGHAFGRDVKLGRLHYAKLYMCIELLSLSKERLSKDAIEGAFAQMEALWEEFMSRIREKAQQHPRAFGSNFYRKNGEFVDQRYFGSHLFVRDVKSYVRERKGQELLAAPTEVQSIKAPSPD